MIKRIPDTKEGAITYCVEESYPVSEKGNVILVGYLLRECTDGTYQVYRPDGEKHFFSIGSDLFAKIKCINRDGKEENIQEGDIKAESGGVPQGRLFD